MPLDNNFINKLYELDTLLELDQDFQKFLKSKDSILFDSFIDNRKKAKNIHINESIINNNHNIIKPEILNSSPNDWNNNQYISEENNIECNDIKKQQDEDFSSETIINLSFILEKFLKEKFHYRNK